MNNFKTRMDIDQIRHLRYLYDCTYERTQNRYPCYKSYVLGCLIENDLIDHFIYTLLDIEKFKDTPTKDFYIDNLELTFEVLDLVGCDYKATFETLEKTIKKAIELSK